MLHLNYKLYAVTTSLSSIKAVKLVANKLNATLLRLELHLTECTRIFVFNERRLKRAEKINLARHRNLLANVSTFCHWWLMRHRKSKTADAHRTSLHDCIYQAFNRVLEQNITNVANRSVTRCSYTRIQDKTSGTKFLYLALKSGIPFTFQCCVLTFCIISLQRLNRNVRGKSMLDGFSLTRVHLKNKSLYIIALGIIEKFTYTWKAHLVVFADLLFHD